MPGMNPEAVATRIRAGLLSFPVTHFDDQLRFDEQSYRKHCSWLIEHGPAALFAAGGTGEFFSLTPAEVVQVVRAAVAESGGRVPVIAGCGYGTALAVELARAAEGAGADGLLLLPPYLVNASQEGLSAHVTAVCQAISIGVIVYNRDNAVLSPETLARLCANHSNLVGLKDGVGDIELMVRTRSLIGERLVCIGGLPTAEIFAPAYRAMGVTTHSSAIFNFMPEWAVAYFAAVQACETDKVERELKRFVLPYTDIRNRSPGYAVAIVKAGMKAIGQPAGPVRPPLTDLTETELDLLSKLIQSINGQ